MRMRIDTGNIDAKTLDEVKTNSGSAALKNLMEHVLDLYNLNQDSKSIKAAMDNTKETITTLMKSLEIDKIEHKGVRCNLTERVNKDINTEKLLEFCKTLNVEGLVKTVEVVDMDALENLIYTKQLDASLIEPFILKTTSVYPKISGKLKEVI